jgi:2-dehydropantoate 2-reductase
VPGRYRDAACRRGPSRSSASIDEQGTVSPLEMRQIRTAVAIGDYRQIRVLRTQPGEAFRFFLAAAIRGYQSTIKPRIPGGDILPGDFRAERALESEESADAWHVEVRTCREQDQPVTGGAMCFQDSQCGRSKHPRTVQSADEGICPIVDLRAWFAAHDHANHSRLQCTSIVIEREEASQGCRQAPEARPAGRMSTGVSRQKWQQGVVPGQSAIEIEQREARAGSTNRSIIGHYFSLNTSSYIDYLDVILFACSDARWNGFMTEDNTPGARPRAVAVVGAGAIGGWLADGLDRAGWRVSLVARGDTLAALRTQGLSVERDGEVRRSRPAAGTPLELGVHDYVLLTVKAQSLPGLVPQLTPLFGNGTVVISGTNGIPWWFFQDFAGPLKDLHLDAVDPGEVQSKAFRRDDILGSVVHATARVVAPARIQVVAADRFILGEPSGAMSARVQEMVAALRTGGIKAESSTHIRLDVWGKLWGNMNMNPLSALTRSGTATMLADSEVRDLCLRMMEEMQRCGERLNLRLPMTAVERTAITRRLGDFRTSMLADLTAGNELEYAPQLGAVVEIAERLAIPAPFCRSVLGLIRLLSASLRRS